MLKITSLFAGGFLLAGQVNAACELNPEFGSPQIYTISGDVITISADAANDTSTPIATYDSASAGMKISYINCVTGEAYGKEILNLTNQNTSTKIFPTLVSGIGVKLTWSNGEAFGNFPSSSTMTFSDSDTGMFSYPANSYFRIEFYKTADTVTLTSQDGDQLLTAGEIGYNYVTAPVPANYAQKVVIGSFKIISTPACTVDDAKTIDFGTVTPAMVSAGVERDLDFSLTCKTDYGTYSTTASITTTTPASDATYIKVTDADGNTDNLGIQILSSSGSVISVDGSILEKIASTTTSNTAQFNWKARLVDTSTDSTRPQNGQFTARAEIVLDIE